MIVLSRSGKEAAFRSTVYRSVCYCDILLCNNLTSKSSDPRSSNVLLSTCLPGSFPWNHSRSSLINGRKTRGEKNDVSSHLMLHSSDVGWHTNLARAVSYRCLPICHTAFVWDIIWWNIFFNITLWSTGNMCQIGGISFLTQPRPRINNECIWPAGTVIRSMWWDRIFNNASILEVWLRTLGSQN